MPWRIWYVRIIQIHWLFFEASYMILLVNASGCKNMDFKATMDGKALVNHVFKTIPTATNDGNCQSMCFHDDRCISFNFGTSATGEKYMCELSESDHIMHPEDLKDRPGTIYRNAENTCNCSKNSTCRFNFVDGTHRCECKLGFVGDNCGEFNPCASTPCLNGGNCTNMDTSFLQNAYHCTCPQGFTGGSCEVYLPEDSSLSWVDAQNDCNKKGMTLPSIHSDQENERIRTLISPGQYYVWIGLKKIGGRWIWADGSKSEYRNWWQVTFNYDCAVMYQSNGQWGERDCSWPLRYFCV